MSHPNQRSFVQACASLLSTTYPDARILEIGSYDVNGSVRPMFAYAREYTGIDLIEGHSVDIVAQGHEFGTSNSYDVVLSCEAFEHNPVWLETFINMVRVCRPGGTVLFTCATKGRLEHGTSRTRAKDSPGTSSCGWNYYRNLVREDFLRCLDLGIHFLDWEFFDVRSSADLYFVGLKRPTMITDEPEAKTVVSRVLEDLRRTVLIIEQRNASLSLAIRAYRLPLRIASSFLPNSYFQVFGLKWNALALFVGTRLNRRSGSLSHH